jgi:hypothetical protein
MATETDRSPRPGLLSVSLQSPTLSANTDKPLTRAELNAGLLAGSKLGKVPLMTAALDLGATVNIADAKGATPLHYAALFGHADAVALLGERGAADDYKRDMDQETRGMGAGGGPVKNIRVYNSPLHWALVRGQVKCVWLLLTMGYSPLDVDECGNNSMHLACTCTATSRETQLLLVKTLMCAGFDPDARNWYGQRAADLLPSDAHEARRLLARASETTRCPSTGVPFGSEELRYLCHSSGLFFSEEASASVTVRAYEPTMEELEQEVPGVPVRPQVTMPARMGSDLLYKVADAESALETALNPFLPPTLAPALGATTHAATARSPTGGGFGSARKPTEDSVEKKKSEPVTPSAPLGRTIAAIAEEEEEEEDDSECSDSDINFRTKGKPKHAIGASSFDFDASGNATRAASAGSDKGAPRKASNESEGAFSASLLDVEGDTVLAPARELTPPEQEPFLFFGMEHVNNLDACASAVASMKGDPALLARYGLLLRRMAACRAVTAAVSALNARRPVSHRADVTPLLQAIKEAQDSGLPTTSAVLEEARVSASMAIIEAELAACIHVVRSIRVANHSNDADVSRIRIAVEEAQRLDALAADKMEAYARLIPVTANVTADVSPKPVVIIDSMPSVQGETEGFNTSRQQLTISPSVAEVGEAAGESRDQEHVQRNPKLCPDLPGINTALMTKATTLADRLTCEIGVTDAVLAAQKAKACVDDAGTWPQNNIKIYICVLFYISASCCSRRARVRGPQLAASPGIDSGRDDRH